VLEVEQQRCLAQCTLAQIRGNRLLAYAQLCQALGVGWSLRDERGRPRARPTRTA
jgi:outer membrane protein TolC